MSDRPLISVLMACYNRADLVGEAIESVLSQSFTDYEYVIVDDGSTDGAPDVVRSYADPRIRLFVNDENLGRSRARTRAIDNARGEYVLWMADDDLLVPDVLEMYAEQVAAHPDIDVFYGNLMLFEGDQDLQAYEPNDWTGRSDRLLGASLVGSCIPDGGSVTRRALYDQVGCFDPEFVRAQDYEFWTRAVAVAQFKKIDQIVYRYRKHDGNVSFGATIDLSYDSKIIRRLLTRHPLSAFYSDDDWSQPAAALTFAYTRVARALLLYQDGYNAARFVRAAPRYLLLDDSVSALFEAYLVSGRTADAAQLLQDAEASRVRPSQALRALRARLLDADARRAEVEMLLDAAELVGAGDALQGYIEAHGYTLDACFLHARLLDANGQPLEAVDPACKAARLDPERDDTLALAVDLRTRTGKTGHNVDVETARARLLERIYPFETEDLPLPTGGPIVTVMVCTSETAARDSLRRQTYTDVDVVEVGDDDRNAALETAAGDYIAWLTDGTVWQPHHLSLLVGREARLACSEALRVRTEEGVVTASYPTIPPTLTAARITARDLVPLSCVLHAADVEARFADLGPERDWDFVVQLARAEPLSQSLVMSAEVPVAAEPDLDGIQRVYQRYERATLFDAAVRRAQAEVLDARGVVQAERGRSDVVVLSDGDVDGTRAAVDAVLANTRVPYALVVLADGGGEEMTGYLRELRDTHEHVKVLYNRRPLGRAKLLNEGLSRANGDFVALLDEGARVAGGWLGRLQWWASQAPQTGIVVPGDAARLDGRAMLLTRGALDRAGGFDTTLRGGELDDFLLRVRISGFEALGVDDVVVTGDPPSLTRATARFESRWGFAAPATGALPAVDEAYERARHFVSFGAEEGYRPDTRPLRIEEAAERNVLVVPPWDDDAAVHALVQTLAELETDAAFWLRTAAGEGATLANTLRGVAADAALPTLLLVDATLAPEREAALYVTADAVYVDDAWPEADVHARRATDCGRPALRGPAELRAWLDEVEG